MSDDEAQAGGGTADTPQDVMTPDLWRLVCERLPDEEAKRHFAATCRYYRMAALHCTCCNRLRRTPWPWLKATVAEQAADCSQIMDYMMELFSDRTFHTWQLCKMSLIAILARCHAFCTTPV